MDTLLTMIQVASGIPLALIGLLRCTYDHGAKRLRPLGWILLAIAFASLISATVIKDKQNEAREIRLHKRIDELTERLFTTLVPQVMESRKEISKATIPEPATQLRIISPQNDFEVLARTYVEGSVSDPLSRVWLVIHPLGTSAYWVQPSITVGKEGTWKTVAYFGRSGDIDVGKHFQIMAVAKPRSSLKEGDVLSEWPEAQWSSQVIVVIRK